MFPHDHANQDHHHGFPRVRGDVPEHTAFPACVNRFSPRARGCSVKGNSGTKKRLVFPACAGMFRFCTASMISSSGFPRVRGDVPEALANIGQWFRFSPRARGCSYCYRCGWCLDCVFPACAGMFRAVAHQKNHRTWFSPRARGCSRRTQGVWPHVGVFPACAGMFRWKRCSRSVKCGFPRVRGDVPYWHTCATYLHWFSPRARGCSYRQ